MEQESRRISGWKAIGAYFGRDRSTVIRWARERGLPVRHVPGGGDKKTVYALGDELDAWAAAGRQPLEAEPPVDDVPPPPRRSRRPAILGGAVIAVLLAALALWLVRPGQSPELPADPKVAALYLQGRDDWAQRDAARLTRAIGELEQVTHADPGFAPAFSALADAYLLAREFGSMPDPIAFDRARRAAERARQLDSDLAPAHRALGFIGYWWEHDRALAGRSFRRALDLDPDDGQTHFWYGNILVDNGEHAAARRELDAARLTDPGSVAIATDRAWAAWSAGDTAAATSQLKAILARSPDFAVAHDCLSIIRLAEGDYTAYLEGLRRRQRARGDPALAAYADRLKAAMRAGGVAAVQQAMIDHALADERGAAVPDHAWAAFVASVAGDRDRLLAILRLAHSQRQVWGSAGFTARIAKRWRDDAEISALLRQRAPPRIEAT